MQRRDASAEWRPSARQVDSRGSGEGGGAAAHDPWQGKEAAGVNGNLQSSSAERSPEAVRVPLGEKRENVEILKQHPYRRGRITSPLPPQRRDGPSGELSPAASLLAGFSKDLGCCLVIRYLPYFLPLSDSASS